MAVYAIEIGSAAAVLIGLVPVLLCLGIISLARPLTKEIVPRPSVF